MLINEVERTDIRGELIIGFPIVKSSDGPHLIDATLISPDLGVVCLDIIEGSDPRGHRERQDDMYTSMHSQLFMHRSLIKRRSLTVPIVTASYAPAVSRTNTPDINRTSGDKNDSPPGVEEYPLLEEGRLYSWISGITDRDKITDDIYRQTLSVLQNIATIRSSTNKRHIKKPDSRGARLQELEKSIATLDHQQSRAVIETTDGVQRIRGLAGSGKTIVLALKAAYLHARYPEWKIAVTYHTRSLKAYLTQLIEGFFISKMQEHPNWDNLRILNAWGAPGASDREGIYHEFCNRNNVDYLNFRLARQQFGQEQAFQRAVDLALSKTDQPDAVYNAVLVDEAQDLPPAFLRLCYEILREPKNLVYAYDELQKLTDTRMQPPEEIFGSKNGEPRVVLETGHDGSESKKDIILNKCYRNSRPILVAAHSLGFGVYREDSHNTESLFGTNMERAVENSKSGLIQMFDYPELWEDIGYECTSGSLSLGSDVTLIRTSGTSPKFLEEHSPIDDIVKFQLCSNEDEQAEWVANEIESNLTLDELNYNDIMIIHTNPRLSRAKLAKVRKALLDRKIQNHHAGVDTKPDYFNKPNSITCTGIHRAKGNEAAMVYVINAEDCYYSSNSLSSIRNRLFTAITRSKAWVRVVGIGRGMRELTKEYNRLKEADFELRFRYPTSEELKKLTIVHRDMPDTERRNLEQRQQHVEALINDFKENRIYLEDFDEHQIEALRAFLGSR
ncbi:MAG: ATP-binding domain-containing protein [Acidimicrobiaceae bacterium]|nr:ATP-binding domain-containing protein [Acidimicrobiaceae bacterium]